MNKSVLIRCLLVSFLVSAVATFLSTSIMGAPAGDEVVLDLEAVDEEVLAKLSDEELSAYLDTVPTRRVSGFERFTYAFGAPQLWLFFFRAQLNVFVAIFASTLLVSFLNARDR